MTQLPERFLQGPKSETFTAYVSRRYSKYGYRLNKCIEYNPNTKGRRWVEHVSDGLRSVGAAHDVAARESYRMDHTGWYMDSFQDQLACGHVYQLPARDGETQYLPAVADPHNTDCAWVDFSDVRSELRDAVRAADRMAEIFAEEEREYEAKSRAESRIEEIADEIKDLYTGYRALRREMRLNRAAVQTLPLVEQLSKAEWSRVKTRIQRLQKERTKLQENYWYSVEG